MGRDSPKIRGLVSIVMGAYNCAPYIAGAIDSILKQDYKKFELIVMDDGSTDGTWGKICLFRDPRIIRKKLSKNHGPSYARNTGLKQSRGEFVTFFDGDDLMVPKAISARVRYLQEIPSAQAVFGYVKAVIDGNGRIIKKSKEFDLIKKCTRFCRLIKILPAEIMTQFFCFSNYLTSILLKHALIKKTGLLNQSYDWGEDLEFAMRLSRITPLHYLDVPVLRYRMHNQNLTHRLSKRRKRNDLAVMQSKFNRETIAQETRTAC